MHRIFQKLLFFTSDNKCYSIVTDSTVVIAAECVHESCYKAFTSPPGGTQCLSPQLEDPSCWDGFASQGSRFKVAIFIPVDKFGLQVKKRAFKGDKTDTQTHRQKSQRCSVDQKVQQSYAPLVALQQSISTGNGCRNQTVPAAVGSALGNFEPLSGGKQLKGLLKGWVLSL